MELHSKLTDEEFETHFKEATLDSSIFTHEAHLRLAWIHLSKYGLSLAIEHICSQLQNYVRRFGASDKFHQTLTVAAIEVVHHFMSKVTMITFEEFIGTYPRLKTHFNELIAQHYSKDICQSQEARLRYVEPDLLPFYS